MIFHVIVIVIVIVIANAPTSPQKRTGTALPCWK